MPNTKDESGTKYTVFKREIYLSLATTSDTSKETGTITTFTTSTKTIVVA